MLSRFRTLGGEPPPPGPWQPERILNDRSVLSAASVNDTVLYQAPLDNNRDPCSVTLLAKRGHPAMFSAPELHDLRDVNYY